MNRIVLKPLPAIIMLFLVSCTSQSLEKDRREKSSTGQNNKMENTAVKKMQGMDESVTTRWVSEIPDKAGLTVLTGRIGITGNEPFLNLAIYTDDQTSYLLRGNQDMMDTLLNQADDTITLAGETYDIDNMKWIKVNYIKTK